MAGPSATRVRARKSARLSASRTWFAKLWPDLRLRRRAWRALKRAPRFLQAVIGLVIVVAA